MSKLITLVVLVLGCSTTLFATGHEADVQEKLLTLDKQIDQAMGDKNVKFLSDVLAGEFTWVHAGAYPMQTKSEVLETVPHRPKSHFDREDIGISVYGDVAIVSSFSTVIYAAKQTGRFYRQRVYVKKLGEWKLISWHSGWRLTKEEKVRLNQFIYQSLWE